MYWEVASEGPKRPLAILRRALSGYMRPRLALSQPEGRAALWSGRPRHPWSPSGWATGVRWRAFRMEQNEGGTSGGLKGEEIERKSVVKKNG